jgi:hypothetical protein
MKKLLLSGLSFRPSPLISTAMRWQPSAGSRAQGGASARGASPPTGGRPGLLAYAPAGSNEPPMPAQQRRRHHNEGAPARAGQQQARRRQEEPVARPAAAADLLACAAPIAHGAAPRSRAPSSPPSADVGARAAAGSVRQASDQNKSNSSEIRRTGRRAYSGSLTSVPRAELTHPQGVARLSNPRDGLTPPTLPPDLSLRSSMRRSSGPQGACASSILAGHSLLSSRLPKKYPQIGLFLCRDRVAR